MPWQQPVNFDFSDLDAYPDQLQRIGATDVTWFENAPSSAVIICTGGTIDERNLGEWIVRQQLEAIGYRQARFTFDPDPEMRKTAAWTDIMAKAKRLMQSGNVQMLRNGWNAIAAHVVGDHGEYNCEISRDDPNSRVITQWTCECPWDQYAFQRTRQWKKFEGRPCAHVLAAYWTSLGTPLDDHDPSEHGALPPGQKAAPPPAPGGPSPIDTKQPGIGDTQQTIEDAGKPLQAPPGAGMTPQEGIPIGSPPSQSAPFTAPDIAQQQMQMLMQNQGVIPPFPMAPPPPPVPMPSSEPGGRPGPYSGNPLQQSWTFSKVTDVTSAKGDIFRNSDMVRINVAEYGTMEGPTPGKNGDGQFREIPKNSIGEVLGQDSTTGWVDVIFPIHDTGPLQPFHIRAWIEPEKLNAMPNTSKPGPFLGK